MIRTLTGDCRTILPTLDAGSVHCCITSPPYYGLRDYGTAQWEGGDAACDHKQRMARGDNGRCSDDMRPGNINPAPVSTPMGFRDTCGKCGARRIDAQIGLEPTPEEYLAQMVAVFREMRRVLRDDGTCWVNMGDSYATSVNGRSAADTKAAGNDDRTFRDKPFSTVGNGAKPKDLLMMPARLALALQADGWWLRSAIVWAKPNPMPESVTDRPTSAYEMVYLLAKKSRYYYDADAVREEALDRSSGNIERIPRADRGGNPNHPGGQCGHVPYESNGSRSLRNVWTIATHAYSDAHFAKPWQRTVDTSYERNRAGHSGRTDASGSNGWDGGAYPNLRRVNTTTGWAAGCKCEADVRPCVVLDPFAGAGTTMLVADRLQRDAIGIELELNPAYVGMATERVHDDAPLFSSWPPAEDPADARMADAAATPEYEGPVGAQLDMFREAAD